MAGTVLRRWNGNGGGRRWGPVFQVAGPVSSGQVAVHVAAETDLSDVPFCEPSGTETVLSNVERCDTQFGGAVSAPAGGGEVLPAAETDFGGAQCLPGAGPSRYDPKCGQREGADVLPISGDAQRICSSGGAGAGRHDVLGTVVGRAAGHPAVGRAAGMGRRAKRSQVRLERTEAGSLDSFGNDAFLSCRIESPSSRVARVTSALHNLCPDHSSLIPAHNSHARMPHARSVVNSVGDTEDGRRLSCVSGGTKSLSTSTRSWGQAFCCV